MRVVVSLTTIPSRVKYLGRILGIIAKQSYSIDQIYLNIPEYSKREGREYPPLPELNLEHVTIIRCPDYGPITKLYPTLSYERDPETIIITLDDDVEYSPTRVETLVKYCQAYPDAATSGRGYIVGEWYNFQGLVRNVEQVTPVSVIEGCAGCAYRVRFFGPDLIDYQDAPEEAFYHDDVWISGYLAKKGISRLVHPGDPLLENYNRRKLPNGLSDDWLTFNQRLLPTINYFKKQGYFNEKQTSAWYTTYTPIFFYFIFVPLLLLLLFKTCLFLPLLFLFLLGLAFILAQNGWCDTRIPSQLS